MRSLDLRSFDTQGEDYGYDLERTQSLPSPDVTRLASMVRELLDSIYRHSGRFEPHRSVTVRAENLLNDIEVNS